MFVSCLRLSPRLSKISGADLDWANLATLPTNFHYVPTAVAQAVLRRAREVFRKPSDYLWQYEKLTLPTQRWMREILSITLEASLLKDEQRSIKCKVVVEPTASNLRNLADRSEGSVLLLDSRDRFSSDALSRIAPAVDRRRGAVVVTGPTKSEPSGRLAGMIFSERRGAQRSFYFHMMYLNARLSITILGPGRLSIQIGDTVVCRMRGRQVENAPADLLSCPHIRDYFNASARRIAERRRFRFSIFDRYAIPSRTKNIGSPSEDETMICQERMMLVVRAIVNGIANQRHGGIVVFGPKEELERRAKCKPPQLAIKYPWRKTTTDMRLRELLRGLLSVANDLGAAQLDLSKPIDPNESEGAGEAYKTSLARISNIESELSSVAEQVAMYSAVDGAVVITDELEVLGFGAIIQNFQSEPETAYRVRSVDGDLKGLEQVNVAGRGTRHRSAVRICHNCPELMAIVVSQDGDVRYIRQIEGQTVFWEQSDDAMS